MNVDNLNNANLAEVTLGAFKIVDSLQNLRPAVQALSAGLLFTALCDANNITATRVLEVVSRLRAAARETVDQSHVRAIEHYIREELK